jgi:4-hydroxy-2-oxoglutarate aldolase
MAAMPDPAGVDAIADPAHRAKFAGVFAPICTPFSDDEEVDYPALRDNLARYAETRLLGYLTLGSNGENRSLTEEERLHVLDEVVRHKGRGQVVMAGVACEAQRDAERFLASAADIGADFGLVLAPGYFKRQMTDEVLLRYYSTLADGARVPLLLYNAPGFSGVTLSQELVGRLATHQNIVGMKDSASKGIEDFLSFQGPMFEVLAGSANFLFPAMIGGSAGGTVSLANSFPDVAIRLFEYGRTRDEANGVRYQEWVSRVNHAISGSFGVPGVKAAMDLAGFLGGIPRRPLLRLEAAQVGALRESLVAEGLLG